MKKSSPLKTPPLFLFLYFFLGRKTPAALMVRERRGLFYIRMYQYSTPSRAAMPRV